MDMLYRGKLMYIDDLVADETVRSRGYGSRFHFRLLLDRA